MTTGADLVTGAYQKLGIKPADSDISAEELIDGVIVLNDMMMELEASGVLFGYSRIAAPADEVRIPEGTQNGIKSQLALYLAPDLGVEISPTLGIQLDASISRMLRIISKPLRTKYPSTLPLGSGNDCNNYTVFNDRFFDENEKENF